MRSLFSIQGRAGRKTFWLTSLALTAVYAVLGGIAALVLALTVKTGGDGSITQFGAPAIAATVVAVAIQPLFFWATLVVSIKRCHDHGRSGLFLFLGFVPLANAWLFVEQAFVPGTTGPNQYGPDPVIRWLPPTTTLVTQA
jgi:uncharacterized membrane protein YhaH (DUF805 family)